MRFKQAQTSICFSDVQSVSTAVRRRCALLQGKNFFFLINMQTRIRQSNLLQRHDWMYCLTRARNLQCDTDLSPFGGYCIQNNC